MTERTSTTPAGRPADGSSVPARLRIVAWIVLAAGLGLLAVVLTVRSALLTEVDREANREVAQEVDEFRTFAARGLDPRTGEPFRTTDRLLSLHLERQFASASEVLVGYDAQSPAGRSPYVVQRAQDRFGLLAEPELLRRLVTGQETSGTADVEGRPFRWGKADVTAPNGQTTGAFFVARFTGPARAEVERTIEVVALVSLGGLLLTAAFAYAVAGQILAPVRAVTRAASRITRADLSQRIEVSGRDDVAALSQTFNAMLDRIEAAFTSQRRFSASASRHLRAPLDVLADDGARPEDRRAAAATTRAILDDLEVLAASEAPDFLQAVPVSLRDLTDQLAADVRTLDPGRTWTVPEVADGRCVLDLERVRAAVRRLARNALQVAPGPAPLRLGTRVDGDAVEVWVADDGPGLTPEQAATVFDREPQVDERSPGLGLAVVRAVADAHDGSAWVESEPGAGAVFGLRLPLVPAETAPADERSPQEVTA